jgi:small subunit ribosomal protein S1
MTPPMSETKESFASLFEQSSGAKRGQRRWHTGENVDVTIVVVAREAVFADLGGKQEGIFERIDLTDAEGKLRVEVGSKISAVVSGIDEGTGQVKLKPMVIRSADLEAPVVRVSASAAGASGPVLVEGARVKGKVTGIERYGIFVQINGTSGRSGRGLVPAQETGTSRGSDLKKHFAVGQEVEAKILAVDEAGKIRLSIAALGADDERGLFEAFKSGQGKGEDEAAPAAEGKRPAAKGKPEPRNFGTLGDLLPKIAPKPAAPKPAAPKAPTGRADARLAGGPGKKR